MAELSSTQIYGDLNISGEIKANKLNTATGEGLSDTNFTQAEKTKLAGLVSGVTANTVVQTTGTSATSLMSQKATTDALNLKANSNDARLSDAREWTASIIPSAEAEAGTATIARKWTAQRVRQAIAAWWATVGTSFGKTILGSADAATARTNLGLNNPTVTLGVNTATANALKTARTISLTGDVTGSASFDGSANASITATVVNNSHNHTLSNLTGFKYGTRNVSSNSTTTVDLGSTIITAMSSTWFAGGDPSDGSAVSWSGSVLTLRNSAGSTRKIVYWAWVS